MSSPHYRTQKAGGILMRLPWRKHPLRGIMDAILYIIKTGCQWRMLPKDFAPWQTVYYYFRKWKFEGVIEDIMDSLHALSRKAAGRTESPSLGIIDSCA